jgi:CRISPR-associated protein Cmr2
VCTLSGRWAARDDTGRADEALSVVADAKRRFREWPQARVGQFPSTASVASAAFRADVAERSAFDDEIRVGVDGLRVAVRELRKAQKAVDAGHSAIPGLRERADGTGDAGRWLTAVDGGWCYPQSWSPQALMRDHDLPAPPDAGLCAAGERAAAQLASLATKADLSRPSRYLAVVVQDADHMGRRLADPPAQRRSDVLRWHGEVSAALVDAAAGQSARLESPGLLGRAVYAGGDDLLGFVPAACALQAAVEVNGLFDESLAEVLPDRSASVAVVFFHVNAPLRSVVATAQELLKDAKKAMRPGFGAAVLRRGGQRARVALPWRVKPPGSADPVPAPVVVAELAVALSGGLSGRLAAGLERDRDEIASLPPLWRKREIRRLIGRHGGSERVASLLAEYAERAGWRGGTLAADLAVVAHFLAAEVGSIRGIRDPDATAGADTSAETAEAAAAAGRAVTAS